MTQRPRTAPAQRRRQDEWSSNCNLGNDHRVCWPLRRYFDRLAGETSPLIVKQSNDPLAVPPRSYQKRERFAEEACFHSSDWDTSWFLLGDDHGKCWVKRRYFDGTPSETGALLTPKFSEDQRPKSAEVARSKPLLSESSSLEKRPRCIAEILATLPEERHDYMQPEERHDDMQPEDWIDNFHLVGCDHRKMWPQRRYFDVLPSEVRPLLTPPSDSTRKSEHAENLNACKTRSAGLQDLLLGCDRGKYRAKRRYFDELPAESNPLLTPPNMRYTGKAMTRAQSSPSIDRRKAMNRAQSSPTIDGLAWDPRFHLIGCDHGATKLRRRYFDGLPSESSPLLTKRS